MTDPQSYAAAEVELEEILAALESEEVDVDELSGHVQRAKTLITWCRAQVASAEVTVAELLADAAEGSPAVEESAEEIVEDPLDQPADGAA
jgi:exodeoxyribonuclease VII small subunit